MDTLNTIWRKLTHTKALEESSGKLETAFFESVYRVTYLEGLSSSDRNVLYLLYSNTIKLSIILFVSSELWFLFIESSNLDTIIDNIGVTLIHLIAMYRYKKMIDNKHIFKELARTMESPYFDLSTSTRQKLVEFWLKRNERYLKLVLGLGTCTLAAWYVYPLVDDLEFNLTVAVTVPFDYRNRTLYPITYIVVLIVFQYTSYFVMVNDVIMQAHLMHLLCQFEVLSDCFENIVKECCVGFEGLGLDYLISDPQFRKRYVNRLGDLVEQHKFILNHTIELRKTLSAPMLGQLAASSMLICFAGYQVTATVAVSVTKLLMSLLYLGYNMFELFIFCRWCEEIKVQSENIRQAVYFSGWECGMSTIPGVRARIMLVIARASKPIVLTAGGLYELSLSSYTTLVKTSYSALTVLLRFK